MNIGMDDLFVQKLAAGARTATIVSANSLVRQKIWGGLRWWYADRRLQSNTSALSGGRPVPHRARTLEPGPLPAGRRCRHRTAARGTQTLAAALWLLRLLLVLFEMRASRCASASGA